jgi:uncharacterized protein (TIGR03083 family)
MGTSETWSLIHGERAALAGDLAGVEASRWSTPSLCAGWSVHDMLAHMLATAEETPARFFMRFASAGFNFDKMAERDLKQAGAGGPEHTLAAFRAKSSATNKPPGPLEAMLVDAVVHSEDIRRPLGISHSYPIAAVVGCLDFVKKSNVLIGGKRRMDGLAFRATDTDWSHGSGPEVAGPAIALLMAATGRQAALDDLSGDGVATLRTRT